MTSPTEPSVTRSGWVRLLGAVVFVLLVAGAFAYFMNEDSSQPSSPAAPPVVAFDSFDHSSSEQSLGRLDGEHEWTSVSGQWSIHGGVAHSAPSSSGASFTTVEVGTNASVSAVTTGRGSCGLVAVFTDLSNFVSLQREDKDGTWKIIVVSNGKAETMGSVAGILPNNNRVSLIVDPPVITAISGGDRSSVIVETLPTGTQAGLFTSGPSAQLCTFDDVAFITPSQ